MSYCRWSEDSDVYLVKSPGDYWSCFWCALYPQGATYDMTSVKEVIVHLQEHGQHGHKVPEQAYSRLYDERAYEIITGYEEYRELLVRRNILNKNMACLVTAGAKTDKELKKYSMLAENPELRKKSFWVNQDPNAQCPQCGNPLKPGVTRCWKCGYFPGKIKKREGASTDIIVEMERSGNGKWACNAAKTEIRTEGQYMYLARTGQFCCDTAAHYSPRDAQQHLITHEEKGDHVDPGTYMGIYRAIVDEIMGNSREYQQLLKQKIETEERTERFEKTLVQNDPEFKKYYEPGQLNPAS